MGMILKCIWLLLSSGIVLAVHGADGGSCSDHDGSTGSCMSSALVKVCTRRSEVFVDFENAGKVHPASSGNTNFTGRWGLASQDNFDAFAAAQGVPWVLRKLAVLDRPQSDIVHTLSTSSVPGDRDAEKFRHRLFEARRTQESEWVLTGKADPTSLSSVARMFNPLFEAVDVQLQWAGPQCPGILVETHINAVNRAHDVTMYRWLRNHDTMVLTMVATNGATAERTFRLMT